MTQIVCKFDYNGYGAALVSLIEKPVIYLSDLEPSSARMSKNSRF